MSIITKTVRTVKTVRIERTVTVKQSRPDPIVVTLPDVRTWGLTLAPANQSGYQTCGSASPGCTKACLNNQGQARVFPSIYQSRVAKTVAFFEHREAFLAMLRHELSSVARLAERKEFTPAVRLNVLSDLPWERLAPWVF